MKKKLLHIFLFLFICTILHGQDEIMLKNLHDSLRLAKDDTSRINALRKIGIFYNRVQPDSAIYFTRNALDLSEKINWTKGIAQNCLNLGSNFIYISKYDSAIYYETRALEAAKMVGDKNRIALIYINRGAAYTETQQFEKAMPDLTESMRISEETGNKDRQARASQGICELYLYQHNNNAALPWGEKALQLEQELGNAELQGTSEMSLSGIYMEKNDFKKAESLLLDATPKLKAAHKIDVVMSAAITLSEIYNKTHQYQKALTVLKDALSEGQYTNEIDQISALYNSIGDTYFNIGKYTEASVVYKKGYEAVKGKNEFQQRQYGNLEGMSNAYAKLGDFRNAYESSQLASALQDSVTLKTQNEKLLKTQAQFETERKEKEIALLKKDQKLRSAELQEERAIKAGAFILSGLLLVIGFLLANRYRVIQKAARMIEIEKLRNSIARDLHDDIGSTLSSININSKMALSNTAEEKLVKGQLEKIKEYSGKMMEGMSDIVWAINPVNDSLEKMVIRMKEFAVQILEPLNIHVTFNSNVDIAHAALDVSRRKDVYLIFKEAINNIAKYSECNRVSIDIEGNKNNIKLKIADDGKGFDPAIVKQGNGLRNMKLRAVAIGASLDIHAEYGKGCTVSLDIPIA